MKHKNGMWMLETKYAYSLTVTCEINKDTSSSKRHFCVFLADCKVRVSFFAFRALVKLILNVFPSVSGFFLCKKQTPTFTLLDA